VNSLARELVLSLGEDELKINYKKSCNILLNHLKTM
jgi:hypothetical protein